MLYVVYYYSNNLPYGGDTLKKTKNTFKKNDLVLICAVACAAGLCAVFFFFSKSDTPIAVISTNGTVVREINLKTAPDETFTLTDRPVSFTIKGGKIRFTNVTCPDHICENYGFIGKAHETAVCMPNKTAITIKNGQ